MNKPKLLLKTRKNYDANYILPACPEAEALFSLIKRGSIAPVELHWIHKMGFDVEFVGELGELSKDLKKLKSEDSHQNMLPLKFKSK